MEKYQTIGSRFVALFIDGLIMIPISIFAGIFAGVGNSTKAGVITNVIVSAIPIIYTVLAHSYYGQTVGKSVVKVKVLDISETQITFTQAVIRSLPQMLPLFITASTLISQMSYSSQTAVRNDLIKLLTTGGYILYGIWSIADIIVCLSSDKKRALHDLIAGTVVVRTDSWSNLSINSK